MTSGDENVDAYNRHFIKCVLLSKISQQTVVLGSGSGARGGPIYTIHVVAAQRQTFPTED